ncbi:MAG: LysR family transcriptional regulator [Burkholderiaceae bacterium]|nr:LysR family transcriptional regulator [Burkholderiaceae bacterium]
MSDPAAAYVPRSALSSLRIKQFMLLLALGNHGSLRKAADELAMSQPAASKSLLELEGALGTQLFARSHSGLTPTAAGRCAIQHAQSIIGAVRRMKYELDAIEHQRQEILRIGLIMGAVTGAFCGVVSRACAARENLLVEAQEGTSAELMLKLQSGELDLVFARSGLAAGQPELDVRELGSEPICIAAGARHPLVQPPFNADAPYTCADLAGYPWISYEPKAPLAALLAGWFDDSGCAPPVIKLRTTSALVTVATLCNTDCLAMLPSSVFKHVAADQRIRKIHTTSTLSLGDYSAYWHRHSLRLGTIRHVLQSTM